MEKGAAYNAGWGFTLVGPTKAKDGLKAKDGPTLPGVFVSKTKKVGQKPHTIKAPSRFKVVPKNLICDVF